MIADDCRRLWMLLLRPRNAVVGCTERARRRCHPPARTHLAALPLLARRRRGARGLAVPRPPLPAARPRVGLAGHTAAGRGVVVGVDEALA